MKFLLDTNAIAEPIRPVPNAFFLRRFRESSADVAIGSVTLHEAVYGVERLPAGRRREALREFVRDVLSTIPVVSYDAAAAEWHARERARLAARGRSVPYADGQIAAIAVVNGLTLITANAKDFKPFRGVDLEDWWR